MSTAPRGRDEVRAAVLSSARELIAERGPDGFTVREVAGRAGVNHALVYRHFGTKADVVEEVLGQEAAAVVRAVVDAGLPTSGTAPPEVVAALLDVLAARPTYWRTLTQAVLDSPEAAVPGTASTTELFAGLWRATEAADPATSAVAGAAVLGWLVFGSFIAETTGADAGDVRLGVARLVADLLGSAPS